MRLAELSDQNRLALGYTPVIGVKFAILAEGVDLVERKVIRVEVTRCVGSPVLKDFIEAFLDRRELVGLRRSSVTDQARNAIPELIADVPPA